MSEIADLDKAVDEFAAEMKARLRAKAKVGWSGWRTANKDDLGPRLLMNAARGATTGDKKSLVDVATLAMMIRRNNES